MKIQKKKKKFFDVSDTLISDTNRSNLAIKHFVIMEKWQIETKQNLKKIG